MSFISRPNSRDEERIGREVSSSSSSSFPTHQRRSTAFKSRMSGNSMYMATENSLSKTSAVFYPRNAAALYIGPTRLSLLLGYMLLFLGPGVAPCYQGKLSLQTNVMICVAFRTPPRVILRNDNNGGIVSICGDWHRIQKIGSIFYQA